MRKGRHWWDIMFGYIEAGKRNVNTKVDDIGTMLHYAAEEGNVEAGKRLLQLGADATLRNVSGYTAMHAAIYRNDVHFCAILPAVCLTQNTSDGYTPLQCACRPCRVPSILLLYWLLEQCEVKPDTRSLQICTRRLSTGNKQRVKAAFAAAFARQRRWTAPRAAWLAACCV